MLCPKCKAEYRLGFTRCADCDVEIMEHRMTFYVGQTVKKLSNDDVQRISQALFDGDFEWYRLGGSAWHKPDELVPCECKDA
jgi:hypothetical protein